MFADTPETFSIFATSPGFDPGSCEAVVCVPTFKRPDMLEATLRSLAAQKTERPFAVIVIENDGAGREGARHAAALMAAGLVPGLVIVEPRQGNCKAYNAGWRCALTRLPKLRFILGIDDDELAGPQWLAAHLAAATTHGADVQAGAVFPHFEDPSKAWLKDHPIFHSHYTQSGPVPILYSSANYLVSRHVLERMPFPYLDESFDYTGGGDSDFFRRVATLGVSFRWVQEAAVREILPFRRSQRDWILARGFRNGILSTLIDRKAFPGFAGRLRIMAKSTALLLAAPLRAALLALKTRSLLIGFYPVQVAVGRWMAEFGMTREQYRKPEQN
jgi:glycosyltransferase involved in cell wall biosynthesis